MKRHDEPARRRALSIVAVPLVTLAALLLATGIGSAQLYRSRYSRENCGTAVDPVTVVFVGKYANPKNVRAMIKARIGTDHANGDPQTLLNPWHDIQRCRNFDEQIATAGGTDSRFHVRLWWNLNELYPHRVATLATPHYDEQACKHHVGPVCVKHKHCIPTLSYFNGQQWLAYLFREYRQRYAHWGNDRPFQKCYSKSKTKDWPRNFGGNVLIIDLDKAWNSVRTATAEFCGDGGVDDATEDCDPPGSPCPNGVSCSLNCQCPNPAGAADFDGDGYRDDVDCDDEDATVHPGAAEVCGDGIDQDCAGGDTPCPPSPCYIECCDHSGFGPYMVTSADECNGVANPCGPHGLGTLPSGGCGVRNRVFNGSIVFHDDCYCCAKCHNRTDYHQAAGDGAACSTCVSLAASYCSACPPNTTCRGGLENVFIGSCGP